MPPDCAITDEEGAMFAAILEHFEAEPDERDHDVPRRPAQRFVEEDNADEDADDGVRDGHRRHRGSKPPRPE